MRRRRLALTLPLVLLPASALAHDHWGQSSANGGVENGSALFSATVGYELGLDHSDSSCVTELCRFALAGNLGGGFGSEKRGRLELGLRILLFPKQPIAGWGLWVRPMGGVHASSKPDERVDHPFTYGITLGVDFGIKETERTPADEYRSFKGWTVQVETVDPPGDGFKPYYRFGVGPFWRKVKR